MSAKTVCRTIFYQILLLFTGLSVGFILNAEWVGIKSVILERSVKNILYPVKYDDRLEKLVKDWGAYKIYINKGCPEEFEIIDENVYYNEEWYWCRYKFKEKGGNLSFGEGTTRVRWKTWEYYYDHDVIDTPEKVKKKIDDDKKKIEKRRLEIEKAKEREKEIIESSPTERDLT